MSRRAARVAWQRLVTRAPISLRATPARVRFWIRFLIALSILGAAHYYVWLRFVDAAQLPAPWHVTATIAIAVLAPSLPFATFTLRRLPRETARPYVWL